MNAIKTYNINNRKKGHVEYGYVSSKWNFRVVGTSTTLMYHVPGGKEVAHKIAEALSKAIIRCGKIDGTARNALNRLIKVKTLADWKPCVDWWSNNSAGQVSVPMVYVNQQPTKGFGPEDLTVEQPAEPVVFRELESQLATLG